MSVVAWRDTTTPIEAPAGSAVPARRLQRGMLLAALLAGPDGLLHAGRRAPKR